jgi:putative MATE family efflux protein
MDHTKELGEEKIGKLLMKFSIPAIVGMLVNALYNIIDRVFVGRGVEPLAISGITFVFPIMTIIMAFGMLVGIGATSLISIRLGQKNKEEAENILSNTVVLLFIVSIIVTIIGLTFSTPMIQFFGAKGKVFDYAKEFITIILFGTTAQVVSFGLNNVIRADGKPKIAMATMLIGACINCVLNPLFIFVFHFGIRGSALATVISQTVSMIWVLAYFFSDKSMLKIRRKYLKLDKSIVLGIFAIGLSPFLMQIAASVVSAMFNTSLKKYGGDISVAAMGTINAVAMLILMPVFGINQGVQPIIGYNYGAKQYDRVKKALRLAIYSATAITTTGFILIELFPTAIISLFSSNDVSFIDVGSHGIRIFLMMLPVLGFQIVSSNYFQATGRPKYSIFLSLIRQVIVLIPLIFILPGLFQLNGIWVSGPLSDFIASVVTAIILFRELSHLDEKHSQTLQN